MMLNLKMEWQVCKFDHGTRKTPAAGTGRCNGHQDNEPGRTGAGPA